MAYPVAAKGRPGGRAAFDAGRRLAAAASVAALLGGCGWISEEAAAPVCPDAAILAEAAELVRFRPGPGRDLTDIQYQVEVAGIEQGCRYRANTVESALRITLVATRGAAFDSGSADMRYFVAVVDRITEEILARQEFDSAVEIPRGQSRAGVVEEVVQRVTIPEGRSGRSYEVLVGLQLTEEQVSFNRQRRGY